MVTALKMFPFKKRSLKAGSRVLSGLTSWRTVNGMISLLREFDSGANLGGCADNTQEEHVKKQFDYKSLLKTNIDVRRQAIDVEVGNIFDE